MIVFTPLIAAAVIALIGAARIARQPEKRSQIAHLHGSLLLLLSFLVLTPTSMKIFRVLTPCFELKTNGVHLHYVSGFGRVVPRSSGLLQLDHFAFCSQADISIDCGSARFLQAKAVAFLMIAIYPAGIPLGYACLLFCFRRLINPLGCDELMAMRVRRELKNTNPRLRAIDFLFSCYRPGAYGFEVFESIRRIALTGLIRYVNKTSGPPTAGIVLSLISVIVFREVQPYENPSTNALCTFAQWQLLSTYLLAYSLLTELKAAPANKLVLVGSLLLSINLMTLFVALYVQVREGDRHVELSLTLAEREMREAELTLEQDQMRQDIEELLKRTGLKVETSASAAEIEAAGPVGKAAKMQEQMFLTAIDECTEFPSFTKRLYPCWVISLTNLTAFIELPEHELCIERLEELLPDSTSPSCAYSFFISQNWEGGKPDPSGTGYHNVRGQPHPDNKLNTKVRRELGFAQVGCTKGWGKVVSDGVAVVYRVPCVVVLGRFTMAWLVFFYCYFYFYSFQLSSLGFPAWITVAFTLGAFCFIQVYDSSPRTYARVCEYASTRVVHGEHE